MASLAVVFDLVAKDNASREIRNVGDAADDSGKKAGRFGDAMKAGLAVGAAAAVALGKSSVTAFVEAEQSSARLDEALKKFPATNDKSRASFDKLNQELAKKTKFDDDATASGQAVLAQFGLTGKQIQDLTPLLQDYAAKTGKDLPSAAAALGKATLGQGRALKEVGINFKDTKDAGQNFEQIMGGLNKQVGGFAENQGKTAAGTAEIMKNRLGEMQETIGAKLVPVLTTMANKLLDIIGFLERNQAVIEPLAIGFGALAAGVVAINLAVKAYTAVQAALNVVLAANPIGLVIIAVAALVAGLVIAYKNSETFRDIVDKAFAKVKEAGAALAAFVTEKIPAAFNAVKDKAAGAMTAMKDAVGNAWTAIRTAIPAAWEAIKGAVVTAFTAVVTYLAGRPQAVVDAVQAIWTAVRNAVAGAWNPIRDAVGTALTAVIDFIKGYPDRVVRGFGVIWNAVRDAVPDAFGQIMDKIAGAFTGKGGILAKVKGFGVDIVDAIVDGIKGVGGKIESTVKGLLNKLPGVDFKVDGNQGDGPGRPFVGGNTLKRVQGIVSSLGGSISSTYRTPARNRAVGGSPRSYHLDPTNPAVDIVGSTAALDAIHAALKRMGGWRELLWRVPNHAPGDNPHVHVADRGGVFRGPGMVWMGKGEETFASGLAAKKISSLPTSGMIRAEDGSLVPQKFYETVSKKLDTAVKAGFVRAEDGSLVPAKFYGTVSKKLDTAVKAGFVRAEDGSLVPTSFYAGVENNMATALSNAVAKSGIGASMQVSPISTNVPYTPQPSYAPGQVLTPGGRPPYTYGGADGMVYTGDAAYEAEARDNATAMALRTEQVRGIRDVKEMLESERRRGQVGG